MRSKKILKAPWHREELSNDLDTRRTTTWRGSTSFRVKAKLEQMKKKKSYDQAFERKLWSYCQTVTHACLFSSITASISHETSGSTHKTREQWAAPTCKPTRAMLDPFFYRTWLRHMHDCCCVRLLLSTTVDVHDYWCARLLMCTTVDVHEWTSLTVAETAIRDKFSDFHVRCSWTYSGVVFRWAQHKFKIS